MITTFIPIPSYKYRNTGHRVTSISTFHYFYIYCGIKLFRKRAFYHISVSCDKFKNIRDKEYQILINISAINPRIRPIELMTDSGSLNMTKPKNEQPATVNSA